MFKLSIYALLLAGLVSAKTDIGGCTTTMSDSSIVYYVPGTGEICSFLDCGGGRAPPKTDVPGCPQYSGTATYSPNFLPIATETSNLAVASPTTTTTAIVESTMFINTSTFTSSMPSSILIDTGGPDLGAITGTPPLAAMTSIAGGSSGTSRPTTSTPLTTSSAKQGKQVHAWGIFSMSIAAGIMLVL